VALFERYLAIDDRRQLPHHRNISLFSRSRLAEIGSFVSEKTAAEMLPFDHPDIAMSPQPARALSIDAADEKAIRAGHHQMIAAWNAGDAKAFIAAFTDYADFIAVEGIHLNGRDLMARFHEQIFDTVVTGSSMVSEVSFVRFISPVQAEMHSFFNYALAGQTGR
jgi:uncharacterized protein (TIGR02246 family)